MCFGIRVCTLCLVVHIRVVFLPAKQLALQDEEFSDVAVFRCLNERTSERLYNPQSDLKLQRTAEPYPEECRMSDIQRVKTGTRLDTQRTYKHQNITYGSHACHELSGLSK